MQAQRARRCRQLGKIEASLQAIPPRDIARTKVAAREPLQFSVMRLTNGFEFGFALAALTGRFRLSFRPLNSFRVEPPEAEPIARLLGARSRPQTAATRSSASPPESSA